jgi:hypothetical protein
MLSLEDKPLLRGWDRRKLFELFLDAKNEIVRIHHQFDAFTSDCSHKDMNLISIIRIARRNFQPFDSRLDPA